MSDLTISILVIFGTGLLLGILFWVLHNKKQAIEVEIQTLAIQKGWVYEKIDDRLATGYRISKSGWVFEAVKTSTGSSNDSSTTEFSQHSHWWTNQIRFNPGILLIGPKQPEIDLGGIGDVIKQAALRLMIGKEADDALGIEEVLIGRMSLREHFSVYTNQEENAKTFLTPEVEDALLRYPNKLKPVVKINPEGLEVKLHTQMLKNPTEIEALIAIGEAFLIR
jgi:hypothetical protein